MVDWIPFLKETSCQVSSFPPSQPLHSVYLWAMLVNSPTVYFCGFQDVEASIKSKDTFWYSTSSDAIRLNTRPGVGKHSLNCFSFTLMHPFLQRGVKPAIKVGRLSTLSVSNLIKEGRNTVNLSRKAVSHMHPAQFSWQITGLWVVQIRLRWLIPRPHLTWLPVQLPDLAEHRLLGSYWLWGIIGLFSVQFTSVQFSSVTQSCPTLCDPMDCSKPDFPVHHQLLEVAQTHVHWVGGTIQQSHPLLSSSPPAFNFSQHQGLFRWISSSYQVARVLEFQL